MKLIDDLERRYPTLDLTALRLLLQIHATPGFSIRELADLLSMDPKAVQMKIAMMAGGRKNRRSSAWGLIAEDRNLADRRKRSLSTTPRGAALAARLQPLTAE